MSSLQFNKIYGPVISTYPALLRHLYNINTLISDHIPAPNNFSKANTQKLYDAIGRPLDRIPSVLVGGTNGKGSTCLKISNGLRSSGIKTGLFVSPHISSFRERVQVNGDLIEESDVLTFVPKVLELCLTQEIPATFFEITFALACLQFESQACDAVVLEVGVGGEWDATNVVYSALSIICSVDLDHTRFLGPTVEAIAANKAGIFKPLRPAIHGPGCPRDVLLDAAIKRNSLLFDISEAIGFNLPGEISPVAPVLSVDDEKYTDALNTRLAHAGLTLLKAASIGALTEGALGRQGMVPGDVDLYRCFSSLELRSEHLLRALSITAPCRWEKVRVTVPVEDGKTDVDVILDLGHNPAAINALMRRAKKEFFGKRVRIIYGMSRDKNANQCIRLLLEVAHSEDLFFIQSKNFRALSVEEMVTKLTEVAGEGCAISTLSATDLPDIIVEVLGMCAKSSSEQQDNALLICGSAYFMPQVRAVLGITEPRDDVDLQREQ